MEETLNTIFALATPIGGAIAIMRISGMDTFPVIRKIFTGKTGHGRITHGMLIDGENAVDDCMVACFESPQSYTGEDMAELYIHSSTAVANSVSILLIKHGLFPAEPGEFSRRAFLNGKMDLAQAEATMDLINASTSRGAASAMRQLSGELSRVLDKMEHSLTDVLAAVDANIDYPEEFDESDILNEQTAVISKIKADLEILMNNGMTARYIREGFSIAIAGRPNVGKSSLFNALLREDRAIVSDISGTTRDVLDAGASFCGLPVRLFDTAGLHDTEDTIEAMGMERARRMLEQSDMIYVVIDGSMPLTESDMSILRYTGNRKRITVINKTDLPCLIDINTLPQNEQIVRVSANSGEGLNELRQKTSSMICPNDETGLITNMRHIAQLSQAVGALGDALNAGETDCAATDIRNALQHIGAITGSHADEAVINRIFERFCVGK